MNKITVLIACLCLFSYNLLANDYEKAWEAISNKDLVKAKELLESALKQPEYTVDASLTLILLESFEGRSKDLSSYIDKVYDKSEVPYPYLFSLWFNEAVAGEYGKKTKAQLKLLQRIQKDKECNGSMKGASRYQEGFHLLKSTDFKNSKKKYAGIGALRSWQFVGPFENTLGSGFDKNYLPITKPEASAVFNSKDNYDISWFTPPHVEPEGWMFVKGHVNNYSTIAYSQTFVYSETDQEVILCAGFSGSIKVWLNDKLTIKEEKEVVTTMDAYKNKVQLKMGYNRVLVQLGYATSSSPNFIVRITDENYNPIEGLKESSEYKEYSKEEGDISESMIPLYAEDYFLKKIKKEPKNPINYILLSKTYIRNSKKNRARMIMSKALELYPENVLLRTELIACYLVLENRTGILKELDWIKQNLPNNYHPLSVEVSELIQDEKYNEAEVVLEKIIETYGKDTRTYLSGIKLAKAQGETEKLLSLIKEGYKKYPDNSTFVALQYRVEKEMNNNVAKAIQLLEKYCDKNYDISMVSGLIDDYKSQGNAEGMLNLINELHEGFPYEATFLRELALFYYLVKRYDKSVKYMKEAVEQAPYSASNWKGLATIYEQKGDNEKTMECLRKSLLYDANQYDLRHKINKLRGKSELVKHLPKLDDYEMIKNTEVTEVKKNRDWYYILYNTHKILYPKGASEEFHTLAIKVMTKQGIDYWQSVDLPYNSYREAIVIEKTEVIKKSGQKIEAERNRNNLVFTDLEPEDVVYIKYKIETYNYGRFAQDYWDKFRFNDYVPIDYSDYCILAPKDVKFDYQVQNSDLEPQIEDFGEYRRYLWVTKDLEALESEPLMPALNDIGMNLHISTIKNWKEVVEWYSAISKTQAKIDFDLKELLKEILPEGQEYSDREKARKIYDYIVQNISYSSIPFRQSAYVPQKPGKTFQTKLGDCKDVSTLFATLGREVGLDIDLVLVDTRDNGQKDLLLPSLNFNHCIAKINLKEGAQYLELTDSDLPFGSMPKSLLGATILDIPFDINKGEENPKLKVLENLNQTPNELHRNQLVTIENNDLHIKCKTTRIGAITRYTRASYLNVDKKRQKKYMKDAINRDFKNPVELVDVSFEKLEELNDSLRYQYDFKVKNEVINIGGMKTFKIPFTDATISPEIFSKEERLHPVEYEYGVEKDASYEDLLITIEEGKTFVEIPKSVEYKCKGMIYRLTYEKLADNKLKIRKEFIPKRMLYDIKDYAELRVFFNSIIISEEQYLAYK